MERSVVLDANLTLGLFLPLPYTDAAYHLLDALAQAQARLYVPYLWEYECVSGLRRAVSQGYLNVDDARRALEDLLALALERVPPDLVLHHAALRWAERLGQARAYDAQYLALAEQLGAELWSADQRLIRAAQAYGATWARWVGERPV